MFLFIIYYYIKGILSVIIRRSFLEARLYDQIPAHRIAYLFHSKYSFNIVFTMFIKRLYQFLWDFTIPRKIWSGWQQMERPNSIMPPVHDITLKDTILRRHEDFYDIFFE